MYFHKSLLLNRLLILLSSQVESVEITVAGFLEKFLELILLILQLKFSRHWFTARTISHKIISSQDIKKIAALAIPSNWATQFSKNTLILASETRTKSIASIPDVLYSCTSCSQHICRRANSSKSDRLE